MKETHSVQPQESWFSSRVRRVLGLLVIIALLTAISATGISAAILSANSRGRIYSNSSTLPVERVAIVFGAGVMPDGSLSLMLSDRLDAAVSLYHERKAQKLLLTGDHGRTDYDEVDAMADYIKAKGVKQSDITLDHAGFSTYDSCYRARVIFGVRRAILVTQRYHMPRALYLCRKLGVAAVGFAQPDWQRYPQLRLGYSSREALAKVKAVWRISVTKPGPRFLGKYEGLNGDPPIP